MYKNILLSILFSFIFSIGDMPKAWKMPSTYDYNKLTIVGVWSIDVNKIIEEFRLSSEYKNAGEYGELSVQMIEQIFVDMKLILMKTKLTLSLEYQMMQIVAILRVFGMKKMGYFI